MTCKLYVWAMRRTVHNQSIEVSAKKLEGASESNQLALWSLRVESA
jgi:hypothetical protein